MSMTFEQAMEVLQRMQRAAPPIASSKLSGVIDLLRQMQSQTNAHDADELPPEFAFDLFQDTRSTDLGIVTPPPAPRPVVYSQDKPPAAPPSSRLLRRARVVPEEVAPSETPLPPAPTPLTKPRLKPATAPVPPPRRVEQKTPSTKDLPARKNTTDLFDDIPDRSTPDDPFDPFNFSDLYSTDQLRNLPDTSDLFRDLPEFGKSRTDELRTASVDSVLGISADDMQPYVPYDDPEPEVEVYTEVDSFDFEALISRREAQSFDDLPGFEETSSGQTDELTQLFDNLPIAQPNYQFDRSDEYFQAARTYEIVPDEEENPLERLFGVTGRLTDALQAPPDLDNGRTLFDDVPDWFTSTQAAGEPERTFGEGNAPVLPSFDDIPSLFGATNLLNDGSASYSNDPRQTDVLPAYPELDGKHDQANTGGLFDDMPDFPSQMYGNDTARLTGLPDDDGPPNSVLSGDEGMFALDDLVRFASSALEDDQGGTPDPTRETDEIPAITPSATSLLNNMNEALRPSLMLLRAQAEMLEDRIAGAMSDAEANMLRLMRDNAETALKLLDSLEQVMQLSDSALKLNVSRFEVIPLLREAGQQLQERARARRHRITVQLDDSLPTMHGDYERLLTLLTDLMDNAVRYTSVGGSSRISVDLMGNFLLFTVADTGIGLTPQDMDFIGQPFWRASHQALVRQQPGTGLRLYLARRILEMHGGELFYSGEPGVGSSFSFTLPIEG